MTRNLVTFPEYGLLVEISSVGGVSGVTAEFIALCKHQGEDNGGYRCRVLQQAVDLARNSSYAGSLSLKNM
jgi:hypothetical protein